MPRTQNLGTANLDNSLSFENAPKQLKCLYYAFANSEKQSPDDIYASNQKLMQDAHWDDSQMAVKLAHRYGFRIHPALLTFEQVKERFTNPQEKLIVLYHLSGPPINKPKESLDRQDIVDILTLPVYEKTEWHAIFGDIQGAGSIKWTNYDEAFNGPAPSKQCIVFARSK
jgi:hypothetical protein